MVIFIIPAYNEEANIGTLLQSLDKLTTSHAMGYHVIVVNDGSSDRTQGIVEAFQDRMPITLINHPKNLGVGEAFRNGFTKALEIATDDDIVVTMEADNTSDTCILEEMTEKIHEGHDVVLASCYAEGGRVENTTIVRLALSIAANNLIRWLFRLKDVHTFSSFYRAYRAGLLRMVWAEYDGKVIEESGFGCMVELLLKLNRAGAQITEVPMVLRCDMRQGRSKMRVMRTIFEHVLLVCRYSVFRKGYRRGGQWQSTKRPTSNVTRALL